MSYCLFNRQEILENAKKKKRYSKEKAVEYYLQNQRVSKEKVSRIDSIQKRSIKK